MLNGTTKTKLYKNERGQIVPSYETLFKQVMEEELRATGSDGTDLDILTYLRKRREEFARRGFYLRPDGTIAAAPTNPDEKYGGGRLDTLLPPEEGNNERRNNLLKAAALVVVCLVGLFFWQRSKNASQTPTPEASATVVVADNSAEGEIVTTPTPELPDVETTNTTLQTIGSLGGTLTLGRPGSLEIHYQATDQTIALPIDPSEVTNKGELRYNEAAMSSDNPVAVWVFGTVLNYSIGIPDNLAQNIQTGDTLFIHTDTGRTLRFVVTRTFVGNTYDSARVLAQDHIGITLFSLPATAENEVVFVVGSYDMSQEAQESSPALGMNDSFTLGQNIFQTTFLSRTQQLDGQLAVTVGGTAVLTQGETVLLFLSSSQEQSATQPLIPNEDGTWQVTFTSSPRLLTTDLFAEFRGFPSSEAATVYLGQLPDLTRQLQVQTAAAWWDELAATAVFSVTLHNPGPGAVRVDDRTIFLQGGDAPQQTPVTVTPALPLLVEPGQTVLLQVRFVPRNLAQPLTFQVGSSLWEVSNFPLP